jgi:hypothetical protein
LEKAEKYEKMYKDTKMYLDKFEDLLDKANTAFEELT